MRTTSLPVASVFLLLLLAGRVAAAEPAGPATREASLPQVVPAVQRWQPGGGTMSLARAATIRVAAVDAASLSAISLLLQGDLAQSGVNGATTHPGDQPSVGEVVLAIDRAFSEGGPRVNEGYRIDIGDAVRISAATPTGVFYGTRTLLQLQRQHGGQLPRGTIVDYPEYARRMLMIDVARKPFPIWVLKDYLRVMAWYKMNELHLHLSDDSGSYSAFRVQSKRFPGMAASDLSYSRDDLRDLQDFAEARGITVTPEIDMPGHAGSLTHYWPDLRDPSGALDKDKLDVTNPRTAERMKELLDEMIPLFDAPDFHIGTDEFHVGGTAARRREIGEAFRRFINTMNGVVRSRGRNCRIWSGFESMPGTTLPDPNITIDMWVTRDAQSLIRLGHNVINSSDGRTYIVPGAHYYGVSNAGIYATWQPFTIGKDPAKNPAKDDPHLLGGKLHIWNDLGPTGYTLTEIAGLALPSIQAFAEKLWGHKGSEAYQGFAARAAGTLPVPDVTMLCRDRPTDADGVVLKLPGERTLATTAASIALPLANGPSGVLEYAKPTTQPARGDLEYPWTLSTQIKRTADFEGRGVILSSDLVEVCANYTKAAKADAKRAATNPAAGKVAEAGLGITRAAGAPGGTPRESSHAADVDGVAWGPLPLNQWVTLDIVGTERKTQWFINGAPVKTLNNQMVCPLRHLGSPTGNSFVGTIKDLTVWDRARPPVDGGAH